MKKMGFALLTSLLLGVMSASRAELPAETLKLETLPFPPKPHWVYVVDVGFSHMTESRVSLVDTEKQEVIGMVTTGLVAGVGTSPDKKELYVTETFYSRGSRGERTDVLTIYDTSELKPIGEVILPNKRFISVTMPYGTVVTADGRFLLQFNFSPATSVSVVDLKSRQFVGEIATPGCSMMYPAASGRAFSMLCSDGKLLTVKLDDSGKPVSQQKGGQAFFNPDSDSINVAPARLKNQLFFVSFLGEVHPLDVAADQPSAGNTWSLLNAADKKNNWRPGGWQYVTANEALGRLYVAMHQGKTGTHKDPASEIWVYDLKNNTRIQRIHAKTPVVSLLTGPGQQPLLYALGADGSVHAYDARSGRYKSTVKGVAETAMVMMNP